MPGRGILFFFVMNPDFLAVLLPWEQWRSRAVAAFPMGPQAGRVSVQWGHPPHPIPNPMGCSWCRTGQGTLLGVSQPCILSPEAALVCSVSQCLGRLWRGADIPAGAASPFLWLAVCTAVPFALHVRNSFIAGTAFALLSA